MAGLKNIDACGKTVKENCLFLYKLLFLLLYLYLSGDFKRALRKTESLSENLRRIEKAANKINSILNINTGSFNDIKILIEVSNILLSCPDYVSITCFDDKLLIKGKKLISEARIHSDRYHNIKGKILTVWDESVLSTDVDDLNRLFGENFSEMFRNSSNRPLLQILTHQKNFAQSLLHKVKNLITAYHNAVTSL